jgi:hypothetical protein
MAIAAMTPENTRTPLIDRSMPPVRMTNVLPTASTRRTEASVAMFRILARRGNAAGRSDEKKIASKTSTTKRAVDWRAMIARPRDPKRRPTFCPPEELSDVVPPISWD